VSRSDFRAGLEKLDSDLSGALPSCPCELPGLGIDDGDEVAEPPCHGDVTYIGCPDVIGFGDLQPSQEIGIHGMSWAGLRESRFPIERLDAHPPQWKVQGDL